MAILDDDKRPSTVQEAVEHLRNTMPPEALAELARLPENQLIQTHYGLAAGIRNGVLQHNKALLKDTGYRHPDDASAEIVKALWQSLRKGHPRLARDHPLLCLR